MMEVFPADPLAEAVVSHIWTELQAGLGLVSCQQSLARASFPLAAPVSDHVPLVRVLTRGWQGDSEESLPTLSGKLSFVVVYIRAFELAVDEDVVARSLLSDLDTIAKLFTQPDFSLPTLSTIAGFALRRIHPTRIEPTEDEELADLATRLVAGEVELTATCFCYPPGLE